MRRGLLIVLTVGMLATPAGAHAGGQLNIGGHVGGRDSGANPVALSDVSVELQTSGGSMLNSATSDASGNYAFLLDPGSYRLVASKTGHVTQCRVYTQNGSPNPFPLIELPTPAQAGTMSGTVTDSVTDDPLQDVTVEVSYDQGCDSPVSTTTGSNGLYFFPTDSLPGPVHLVTYSKPGYNSLTDTVTVFTGPTVHDVQLEGLDTVDPRTRIKSVTVAGHRATVKFKATDPLPSSGGINFTCRLDDGEAQACESPETFRRLSNGRHKVRVVAFDAAGNFDETPAREAFRIG